MRTADETGLALLFFLEQFEVMLRKQWILHGLALE